MKKILLIATALLAFCTAYAAQDGTQEQSTEQAPAPKKKVYRGFEGGVLFNTGWAFLNFPECGYKGGGVPLGVGGRGLALLGDHFRAGGEGYMNTFKIDEFGSESKYAFGGAMADFYWIFGPVMTYVGCNVGGGILTTNKKTGTTGAEWDKVEAYFNNDFIWSACPYLGAQIKLAKKISLIVQVSYTTPFGDKFNKFSCLNTSIGLEFGN